MKSQIFETKQQTFINHGLRMITQQRRNSLKGLETEPQPLKCKKCGHAEFQGKCTF